MLQRIYIFTVAIVSMLCITAAVSDSTRVIRIGAFNYYPGIFKDTDGGIKGFYVDALAEIAKRENLRIEYVYGSWSDGLDRLQTGKVDILTSVAYTEERSLVMDYGKVPLLTVWGVLYAPNTSELDDILDANGKKIGVMKNDMNARHFMELTGKFNIPCEFIEFDNFDDVFLAVQSKTVDAGVANVTFGAAKQNQYKLRSTGVIFNPFEIYFAAKKGQNQDILALFDTYLQTWKHQEVSVFNRSREAWSHGNVGKIIIIPAWLHHTITLLIIVAVLAAMFIVMLKLQVKKAVQKIRTSEAALRISEQQYRDVVEHTQDLITRVDSSGTIVFVNYAAVSFWGIPPEECIGKNAFGFIHPDDQKVSEQAFSRWLTDASDTFAHENRQIALDGSEKYVSWIITCIRNTAGTPIGFASIGRDITEAKRAETERAHLEQQIQRSSKLESLGILAGGIAHDFNNLMAGLFGYIDLALEASQSPATNTFLSKALGAIERARDLTRQLLTFAKGGAPVKKVQPLFPFIHETTLFALSGSNVSCKFDIADNLLHCDFDKNQIGQVIDNIVINAHQAMPGGGTIEFSARNVYIAEKVPAPLPQGRFVKISIKDFGIGIPKEQLSSIFDPFFTTKSNGHGLGLAMCYSIINRHGGLIDVESEPGKGTTFHIYLPASSETFSEHVSVSTNHHSGCGEILIMDDEAMMLDILENLLVSFGYSVTCKKNGSEAVEYFTSAKKEGRKFVALIFDLTVPGNMGGFEALEQIRTIDKTVPVFVASGYASDPIMKDPAGFGFTDSLCKPFKRDELIALLNSNLPVPGK